jgi:GNAT superfamily N-acetyltransferase
MSNQTPRYTFDGHVLQFTPILKATTREIKAGQLLLPFGLSIRNHQFVFEDIGTNEEKVNATANGQSITVYPVYSETENFNVDGKKRVFRFRVATTRRELVVAQILLLEHHYVGPPARGLYLLCEEVTLGAPHKPGRLLGCAVVDTLLHGDPRTARLEIAKKIGMKPAELIPLNRREIADRMGLVWLSRIAVLPKVKNKGLSQRLLYHIESVAKQMKGGRVIEVYTTVVKGSEPPKDRDFLLRAGYELHHQGGFRPRFHGESDLRLPVAARYYYKAL